MIARRVTPILLAFCIGTGCSDDDGAERDAGAGGDAATSDAAPSDAAGPDASAAPDGAPLPDGATPPDGAPPLDSTTPWVPPPGTTWHIQYTDTLDTTVDVEVYNIDLFDTQTATITSLQAVGRRVICYFSAGSYEDWRPDEGDFPVAAIGDPLDGWPGEYWLDVTHTGLRPVMAARLDLAVTKGCDGVDPDNVDGYTNDTGFSLTYGDQLTYNTWMASQAHLRGLAIGLKNDLEQIGDLEPHYDWALNEECLDYSECHLLHPFIQNGKAVFHLEYVDQPSQGPARQAAVCGQTVIQDFSTLIKTWDLDAWFLACP